MIHILLIADGRSPITKNWLRMLSGLDCRVSLVSTFPCEPVEHAVLVGTLPVGFSRLAGGQVKTHPAASQDKHPSDWKRALLNQLRPLLLTMRSYTGPLLLGKHQKRLAQIIEQTQPDLVHALRIPFEGMLSANLPRSLSLVVSVWGNDLTLHARSSQLMDVRTRQTLKRADGLLADASRDVRLAKQWGLHANAPCLVVPGNGGLDLAYMQQVIRSGHSGLTVDLTKDRPVVVNPRGFRPGSVHQDIFFKSIPLVLEKRPDAYFVCSAMYGQPQANKWVEKLQIQDHVLLLPYLQQEQLWQLFTHAQVYVSLSSHDGTPNTFLESLACGCFPVVGDIESLREWITNGRNGLLVDPHDPRQAASAILRALEDEPLRMQAFHHNQALLKERADMHSVRSQVREFFDLLLNEQRSGSVF